MDKIFVKFGQLSACHTVVAEYYRFMCLLFNIKCGLQLMMLECGLLHVCCYAIKYVPTKTGSLNIFGRQIIMYIHSRIRAFLFWQ